MFDFKQISTASVIHSVDGTLILRELSARSTAVLNMGVIDDKAKEGAIKPKLWWRYRDDIFDIWTQGEFKLLEYINYINSLYPTIKFELVYSEESLNMLDLTLHLQNGYIVTDIYSKPTDSHLYFPFTSSHPYHCKNAIPYGVALRVKRNCSTAEFTEKPYSKYKAYFKQQNYDMKLVDKQFEKAIQRERSIFLSLRTNAMNTGKNTREVAIRFNNTTHSLATHSRFI